MHLFGSHAGPHMAHFHIQHSRGRVVLDWEVRNAESIRWRVLRSQRGFAEGADALPGSGQVRVSESESTHLADDSLDEHTLYFYTVFSLEQDGTWQRQVEAKVKPGSVLSWFHPQAKDITEAKAGMVDEPTSVPPLRRDSYKGAWADPDTVVELHRRRLTPLESGVDEWLRMGGD